MWADFDAFCRERGDDGLSYGELGPAFVSESPWLNLYRYPAEVDYRRDRPLGPTWHRLDSTVRAADTTWELPEHLRERDGALIYLSLGSLGSADVGLMQRLVDLLATTEHRVIVSKGRWPTRSRSTTTRPARGSCRSRPSCRRSTWSSPTAATTPSPRRSTTASR